MNTIKEMVSLRNIQGLSGYLDLYRRLEEEIKRNNLSSEKTIKIALLASFTIKGIKEALFVKCCSLGVIPKFYVSDYNQYHQDILNSESGLYQFHPDLAIIFVDIATLTGDLYFSPYQISDEQRREWVSQKLQEVRVLVEKIERNSSAKILLHNFEVPVHSPMGILEGKQSFGFIESIEALNAGLRELSKKDPQLFIFDYDTFCSKLGKRNTIDYKMYYLGDIKLNFNNVPLLCDEYLSYIKPLMSLSKKCIVLDLDNTLWGGIIGEDGLGGIQLGPTPEGRPFWEFQKYILALFKRGVVLAINSKNNLEDVLKVIREHPYMVLKEEHFAAMRVNWNDKVSNMKEIAKEIVLGLDSLVYIDDDKLNREMVKATLPEVCVIDLPEDNSLYLKTIIEANDFNTVMITEEDKKRGKMYVEQRKRREFQEVSSDITEFLKGLELVITVEKANSFNIPRIAQMIQRTNQFNMTTRRHTEETIKKFSKNDNFLMLSIKIEDRFGDYGIAGAVIIEKEENKWRIDTFLLSCRIIGRKAEEAILFYIAQQAKRSKAELLVGEFIPTKKNSPASDFYKNNGFSFLEKKEDLEIWEFDLRRKQEIPDFIKLIEK